MKIVSLKICPFVQRVIALLEAKGLPYDVEYITLDNKPQWFLEISPNAQVPVLITDDGEALFESDAIFEYIEESYAPLQANLTPVEKAQNRAWTFLATKHYLTQCSAQRSADAGILAERLEKLEKAFDTIEAKLTGSTYFAGEEIGTVDIAWLVLLHRACIIEQRSGHDFIGDRPKLKAWQNALMLSGLPAKSVAPDFVGAFSDF
ncbi:MAG: glutathione S-transferase family protein [Rhodobacteraceae bacterium]|nr:glutathione S-transferase family protein [Paracoccaceae bacterium]